MTSTKKRRSPQRREATDADKKSLLPKSREAARMREAAVSVRKKVRRLREEFRKQDVRGKEALRAGDYDAVGDAIRREGELIQAHRKLIEDNSRMLGRTVKKP